MWSVEEGEARKGQVDSRSEEAGRYGEADEVPAHVSVSARTLERQEKDRSTGVQWKAESAERRAVRRSGRDKLT